MPTLHSSVKSLIADIQHDDLVFVITGQTPYRTALFIGLLEGNDHISAPILDAKFCVTRVDHPSSQDQVVLVSVSKNEVDSGLCSALEITSKKFIFFFFTGLDADSYSSVRNIIWGWPIPHLPEQFSTCLALIEPDTQGVSSLRSVGFKIGPWINSGWGVYILHNSEYEEAWGIIDAEITRSMGGIRSRLQGEMMVLKFRLYETEEGAGLCKSLQNLLKEEKSTLKEIQARLETTADKWAKKKLMEELKDAYILYTREIRDLLEKMELLGVTPGDTIVTFFQKGRINP